MKHFFNMNQGTFVIMPVMLVIGIIMAVAYLVG